MCLLVVGYQVEPGRPLVVAANRDERYDRLASPVAMWPTAPRILAGRDEEAGGTWLAVNEHGVVAGLTNQRSGDGVDPTRRTRGELPLAAARHRDARRAVDALAREVDPAAYNPCSLLVGDRQALFSVELVEGAPLAVRALAPGWHVLENRPYGAVTAKTAWATARATRLSPALASARGSGGAGGRGAGAGGTPAGSVPTDGALVTALGEILADHTVHVTSPPGPSDPRPAEVTAACIHTAAYGTRSATIVVVHAEPSEPPRVITADGPPCTSPFVDATGLWG